MMSSALRKLPTLARMSSTGMRCLATLPRSKFISDQQREMGEHLRTGHAEPKHLQLYPDRKKHDVDLASCDYLGLAEYPDLNEFEANYIREQGHLTFNRPQMYPRSEDSAVRRFEKLSAEWLHASDAFLCSSGTEANLHVMNTILLNNKDMPVYIDKYTHATVPYGARIAGRNDILFFKHNSIDELLNLVKENGPGVICLDAVYSSMGTIPDWHNIVDIARKYNCLLMVDEAHSTGMFGNEGEGLLVELGLEKEVDFRTTSCGKSFGAWGGLVLFSERTAELRECINLTSPTARVTSAVQECLAERLIKTLDVIKTETWHIQSLKDKCKFFKKGLIDLGYGKNYVTNSASNIIPLVPGVLEKAHHVISKFYEEFIYPSAHFYPAAPRNRNVVRITICDFNTYEDIQKTLDLLKVNLADFRPWEWPDTQRYEGLDLGYSIKG